MRRYFLSPGIVLKSTNIGEADKILTVLTALGGKIKIKAKGVRKLTSRRRSSVEPFNHVRLSAVESSKFLILTEIETINNYSHLKTNLTKISAAYHLCELVDRMVAENQGETIYRLLVNGLSRLESQTSLTMLASVITQFEQRLLSTLGFGLPENTDHPSLVSHIESILEKPLKSRRILRLVAHLHPPS